MIRKVYSIWVIICIAIPFILMFVPFFISLPFKKMHRFAVFLNYIWGWIFFRIAFIPIKTYWEFKRDKKQQYILCANHFSYLDAPALALFPAAFKFVGKSQLGSIPIFGIMYNTLHITVDRKSYRSRAQSLSKAREAIDKGYNLGFFPEGGVRFKEYPKMAPFKDGAFRLACEKNIPIIPVTFPNNHFILEDNGKFEAKRMPCIVYYHQPIWPENDTDEAVKSLKFKVNEVIQNQLNQQ